MEKVTPIDEEYMFDDLVIVSQTDPKGIITYANKAFCTVSGYTVDELVGQPHSIIRHPDMPAAAFQKLWDTIQDGQAWNGIVKNLRKDGRFYWVDTEILPIKDKDDNITGYIAARRAASRKDIVDSEETYKKMQEAVENKG
ncbi:MAG: PAS domain-containing protein [Sulfurimonas sp.]